MVSALVGICLCQTRQKGGIKLKSRFWTVLIGFVVPVTAIVLLFPLWNRVEPFVLGFSFNYFWMFLWLFLTSGCLYLAYILDPLNDEEEW